MVVEQAHPLGPAYSLPIYIVFTDVGIQGYACYDCCMLSSPAFVMHGLVTILKVTLLSLQTRSWVWRRYEDFVH